jgi:hypothetical protein
VVDLSLNGIAICPGRKNAQVNIRWWLAWLSCPAIDILLQLTVVVHVLQIAPINLGFFI